MTDTIPGGHILVARQISNSGLWIKRPLFLKCFLWILINANHTDRVIKGYDYKRGEVVTTYAEITRAMSYYHNKKSIADSGPNLPPIPEQSCH